MRFSSVRHAIVCFCLAATPLWLSACGGGGGGVDGVTAAPNSIAGKVTLNGAGKGQVKLNVTGDYSGFVFSDGNGVYRVDHLPNGHYTVTPSLSGYTFSPASATVDIVNNSGTVANFTTQPIQSYSVSGKISTANVPARGLAGVTLAVTNVGTGATVGTSPTSDGNGSYTLSGLTDGQSYLVTPSHPGGYSFTPASQTVAVHGGNVSADFSVAVSTWSIGGKIATSGGAGVGGLSLVLLQPNTGARYGAVTDLNGVYLLKGLPDAYYQLNLPTGSGYDFLPDPLSAQLAGADLTGQDISATPSGTGTGGVVFH